MTPNTVHATAPRSSILCQPTYDAEPPLALLPRDRRIAPENRAPSSQGARQRALLEQVCNSPLLPTMLNYLSDAERLQFLLAQFDAPKNALNATFDNDRCHRILKQCHQALDVLSAHPEEQSNLAVAVIAALPHRMHDPTSARLIGEMLETSIGLMTPAAPAMAKILGLVVLALPRVPIQSAQYLLTFVMHRMHHLVGHPSDLMSLLSCMLTVGIQMDASAPLTRALYSESVRHLLFMPQAGEEQERLVQVVQRLPQQHRQLFHHIAKEFFG